MKDSIAFAVIILFIVCSSLHNTKAFENSGIELCWSWICWRWNTVVVLLVFCIHDRHISALVIMVVQETAPVGFSLTWIWDVCANCFLSMGMQDRFSVTLSSPWDCCLKLSCVGFWVQVQLSSLEWRIGNEGTIFVFKTINSVLILKANFLHLENPINYTWTWTSMKKWK